METIGHFDYRALRAVETLGNNATGENIHKQLVEDLEITVNPGQMYLALDRLLKSKLISGHSQKPTRFTLSPEAAAAMEKYRSENFTE